MDGEVALKVVTSTFKVVSEELKIIDTKHWTL